MRLRLPPAALALAVLLAFLPTGSANEDDTRVVTVTYVGSGELLTSRVLDLHLGGGRFVPQAGDAGVTVLARDALSGVNVNIALCQDLNGDARCGPTAGEPFAIGCGSASLAGSTFDPTRVVTAFVLAVPVIDATSCPAASPVTTGTLTARFV